MTSQYYGGITGGAVGGLKTLESYHESNLSREKALLIRNIAQDLKHIMKFKDNIDTEPIEKLVEQLKHKIPNPQLNQSLKTDAHVQNALCQRLAESINKRHGKTIVRMDASPHEVCLQVGEVMYSLFNGLKGEFLGIAVDVKRNLSNLVVLKNSLQQSFDKLYTLVQNGTDDGVKLQSMSINQVYRDLITEIDRQMAILANITTSVIDPTTRTIADLTEKDTDFRGFVRKLGDDMGGVDLSRKLTYVLNGVSHVATLAAQIDRALKSMGHSVSEYKNYKSTPALVEHLHRDFENKNKHPSSELLNKFVAAIQMVKENDYAHDDIIAFLNKKKGGAVVGGLEGNNSLGKRLERQFKTRDILFADLESRLEVQYRQITASIDVLAKRFGSQIGMDDHLAHFVQCMSDLKHDNLDREKFYLALTGYQVDPSSKEERQRFLGHLDAVSKSLKPLIAGSSGSEKQHFDSIKSAIDSLLKTIDGFKDTYLKPLTQLIRGAGRRRADSYEDDEDDEAPSDIGMDGDLGDVGGAPSKHSDASKRGGDPVFVTLSTAVDHLQFFYNVARVKHNLAAASKDIKSYSKDYESILGDAVGDRIIKIKTQYEATRKKYDEDGKEDEASIVKKWVAKDDSAANTAHGNTAELKAWRQSVKDNALLFMKEQMTVKVELMKTVEAVDIYLGNFADAVASNPDSIKDLDSLLKTVDIVAKWFTEKSGDTIANMFEITPSVVRGPVEFPADYTSERYTTHYYDWVASLLSPAAAGNPARLPANPFLGRLPGQDSKSDDSYYAEILLRAKKSAMAVRVLDNLVSTFAKLGTPALVDKTFMPAGVIFKNLRQYMYHSAIVMGAQEVDAVNNVYEAKVSTAVSTVLSTSAAAAISDPHVVAKGEYVAVGPVVATAATTTAVAKASNNPTQIENWVRARFAMAFSSIYKDEKPINGYSDCWYETDQLFIMTIKSMVAKVFTVIGTYGIFNRPLDKYSNLNSTRLILGGDFSTPEIKADVVELYIRLPLLAEFYRELFDFENADSIQYTEIKDIRKKITMVPEFDGVFEGFIRIIFDDAKYVKDGIYSELHIKALIREINDIAAKYRSDKTTVYDVLSAFVAEINRRYGIVKLKDVEKYSKASRRYDVTPAYNAEDRLEYNLLGERDTIGRRVAPSDKYDHLVTPMDRKIDNPMDLKYRDLVYKFRGSIDSMISRQLPKRGKPRTSFDGTVRSYKRQLEMVKDNQERYVIVLRAMQGVDQLTGVNHQKAIMYHELVVAPLNTLNSVYRVLDQFVHRIRALDTDEIYKAVRDNAAANKGYADLLAELKKTGQDQYVHPGYTVDVNPSKLPDMSVLPTMTRGTDCAANNILVYKGQYGAKENLTWAKMDIITRTAGAINEYTLDGIQRFSVDHERVFKDLVNLMFALGADLGDTTHVKVQGVNMILEYGQLAEYCHTTLNGVRKNLELFRGIIDNKVIMRSEGGERSEGGGRSVAPTSGSIYYLEDRLMEGMFKASRGDKRLNIISANETIGRVFKRFTTPWKALAQFTATAFLEPKAGASECDKQLYEHQLSLLRDSFEAPMAELLYWQTNTDPSVDASGVATFKHPLKQPLVRNKNSNEWPYAVIPSIERAAGEDDDIKNVKSIQDTMIEMQREMRRMGESGMRRSTDTRTNGDAAVAAARTKAVESALVKNTRDVFRVEGSKLLSAAITDARGVDLDKRETAVDAVTAIVAELVVLDAKLVVDTATAAAAKAAAAGAAAAPAAGAALTAANAALAATIKDGKAKKAELLVAQDTLARLLATKGKLSAADLLKITQYAFCRPDQSATTHAVGNGATTVADNIAKIPNTTDLVTTRYKIGMQYNTEGAAAAVGSYDAVPIAYGAVSTAASTAAVLAGATSVEYSPVKPTAATVAHAATNLTAVEAILAAAGAPAIAAAQSLLLAHQRELARQKLFLLLNEELFRDPRAVAAAISAKLQEDSLYDVGAQLQELKELTETTISYKPMVDLKTQLDEEITKLETLKHGITDKNWMPLDKNLRDAVIHGCLLFYYPSTGAAKIHPTYWGEVDGNCALKVDVEVDESGLPMCADIAAASGMDAAAARQILEIGGRYNALYAQRERILQSTIRTPIDQRCKWYTDPANADEGVWFLGQLKPEEAMAGVSEDDRKASLNQFDAGLLVRFNEILSKYLYNGWDVSTRKMYTGLINKFATGSHVAATVKGQALNDINVPFNGKGVCTGLLGVPAQHVGVFASLARAMRNIMTNTRRTGDPEFRCDTMMELPINVKETLKANLPLFDKLFRLVTRKAELLRQITHQVSLVRELPFLLKYGVNRAYTGAANVVPNPYYVSNTKNIVVTHTNIWTGNAANVGLPDVNINRALLEHGDLVHVATGFLIRNAAESLLKTVDAAAIAIGAAGAAPADGWVRGLAPTVNTIYKAGTLYQMWSTRMCHSTCDSTLYVGYAPAEDLCLEASRRWHIELIDEITNAANSVQRCCSETYKELADEPKYLETHEGSISDYINQNKVHPIMLTSQLQISLRPRYRSIVGDEPNGGEWCKQSQSGYARANYMLPVYKSGEVPFKFNYGARLVLGRSDIKPGLEYMPGMTGLLERYNNVSSNDGRLEKTDLENTNLAHVMLLRYLADIKFYRSVLDTGSSGRIYEKASNVTAAALAVQPGAALYDTPTAVIQLTADRKNEFKTLDALPNQKMYSYPMLCTLDEDIAITESSDQLDTTTSIVKSMDSILPPVDTRGQARILNIIDMNIVPINVHALQREIPLINIINYSYSCDKMVQETVMNDTEQHELICVDKDATSSKHMLTKLLLYPYCELKDSEFYGPLARIMTGDSGLDLGRPKFLSDQMWNKVLLQELYPLGKKDESGPRSDSAQLRMLQGVRGSLDQLAQMGSVVSTATAGVAATLGVTEITAPMAAERAVLIAAINAQNLLNAAAGPPVAALPVPPVLVATAASTGTQLVAAVDATGFQSALLVTKADTLSILRVLRDYCLQVKLLQPTITLEHVDPVTQASVFLMRYLNKAMDGYTATAAQINAVVAAGIPITTMTVITSTQDIVVAIRIAVIAGALAAATNSTPAITSESADAAVAMTKALAAIPDMAIRNAIAAFAASVNANLLTNMNKLPFYTSVDTLLAAVNTGMAANLITAVEIKTALADFITAANLNVVGVDFKADLAINPTVLGAATVLAPLMATTLSIDATSIGSLAPRYRQVYDRLQAAYKTGYTKAADINKAAAATLVSVMVDETLQAGEPSSFENTGALHYAEDGKTELKPVPLKSATDNSLDLRADLATIGRMRFDTTFVRNIVFLTNMQRVMRMKMRDEVQFLESPVVNSSSVLNRQITEYSGNEMFDANVFNN